MPKGKRKLKQEQSKLLQAMQFLSVCQKDTADNDAEMYCSLQNHTAIAFNGVLAAGIKIDEDLDVCPHTYQMILALSRCGEKRAITQLTPETLQIRSDEFEAFVPCCKRERLTPVNPDAGIIPVSDSLTGAIEMAAPLASEKADVIEAVSIQLNVNSLLATNRMMIMEVWHGSNLPFGELLIPKVAATALGKIKKQIVSIGIKSNHTFPFTIKPDQVVHEAITFWFADGSWLRTNLFKGKWRNELIKLPMPSNTTRPIPASFFETVKNVLPFSKDGKVYCYAEFVGSHNKENTGAGYSQPQLDGPVDKVYIGKDLLLAGKMATAIDEDQSKKFTMFFGGTMRCAVWHDVLVIGDSTEIRDEDIPF